MIMLADMRRRKEKCQCNVSGCQGTNISTDRERGKALSSQSLVLSPQSSVLSHDVLRGSAHSDLTQQ